MDEIVLNEVYFGEPPELLDAVVHLRNFRRKYMSMTKRVLGTWNADPDLDKFNQCIAKAFGFRDFYLQVEHGLVCNAYTYGCKLMLSNESRNVKIYRTPKGFKYNNTLSAIVYVYTEIIFNKEFTDREVMAVILHEIGHNFSNELSPIIDFEGKFLAICSLPYLAILLLLNPMAGIKQLAGMSNTFRDFYIKMSKNQFVSFLLNGMDLIHNGLNNIILSAKVAIPGLKFLSLLNPDNYNPFSIFGFNMIGFLDENIADNFATMYGFGPELVSALNKFDYIVSKPSKVVTEIPVIGWISSLLNVSAEFVTQLFDAHPTNSSRRKAQYNYLLQELKKKDINPKLRKELEEEVYRMEDQIRDIENDCGKLGGRAVGAKMNQLLDKLKHGDDVREYIINSERYGDIYDRPEYRNESGIVESFMNTLNTKML